MSLWHGVNSQLTLRTEQSPPPRDLDSLRLLHKKDLEINQDYSYLKILVANFKGLRRLTRLLIRHARNLRRLKYVKALLRMFVNRPSVALKYIVRSSERENDPPSLPTYLSRIRDVAMWRITVPREVIAKII